MYEGYKVYGYISCMHNLHISTCVLVSCSTYTLKYWAIFMKGLNQGLGLTFAYKYIQLKPKIWLRPFMNMVRCIYNISVKYSANVHKV